MSSVIKCLNVQQNKISESIAEVFQKYSYSSHQETLLLHCRRDKISYRFALWLGKCSCTAIIIAQHQILKILFLLLAKPKPRNVGYTDKINYRYYRDTTRSLIITLFLFMSQICLEGCLIKNLPTGKGLC